jgi:putative flippase GtrA
MSRLWTAVAGSTLARFLLVGGVSYVVNQVLLSVLYEGAFVSLPRGDGTLAGAFDLALFLASVIALEVSILVRFVLNDQWTFAGRHAKSLAARFYQSNFTSFGSPLISLAAVNILTPYFGVNYLIANSLGILLGLAWNWFWSVRLVWPTAQTPPRSAAGGKWGSEAAGVARWMREPTSFSNAALMRSAYPGLSIHTRSQEDEGP